MAFENKRPALNQDQIDKCHKLVDELAKIHKETNPELGKTSEAEKKEKALIALNKIGEIAGHLTEWAECQIFGIYYHMAKSNKEWMNADECNKHENELIWYGNNLPDDACTDPYLEVERADMEDILHNNFKAYISNKNRKHGQGFSYIPPNK